MELKCKNCGSLVERKPSEVKRNKGNVFCNRSCAATFNNKKIPKRKRNKRCSKDDCNELTKSWKHTLCEDHHKEYIEWSTEEIKKKTIGEYRNRKSVKGKHPSWKHAGVRTLNRSWNKHLTKYPCKKCGYKLHVELCHIIPVSDFPDSALLGEVNSESNVVPLCRNCHWESHNGIFEIRDIV